MESSTCIKVPSLKSNNKVVIITQEIETNNALYDKLLNLANTYFGERGWSHTITNQTVDYTDYINGKHFVGCITFIKVQLKDGIFHEEASYYVAEGPEKGLAIQKARNISAMNAFKRALQSFGGKIELEMSKIMHTGNSKTISTKSSSSECSTPMKIPNGQAINGQFDKIKAQKVPQSVISEVVPTVPSSSKQTPKSPDVAAVFTDGSFNIMDDDNILQLDDMKTSVKGTNVETSIIPPTSTSSKQTFCIKMPVASSKEVIEVKENKKEIDKALSEEEAARLLRKQKQKEKQELYRKLYIEKQKNKQG